MTRELTRRQAITGPASMLSIGGSASLASADADRPADALPDREDAEYPRCVYTQTDDGEWEVSMPINIHARVPGLKAALSVVEDAVTGLSNIRWTLAFPIRRRKRGISVPTGESTQVVSVATRTQTHRLDETSKCSRTSRPRRPRPPHSGRRASRECPRSRRRSSGR